ncbi:aminotransferase class I/II-fold pyridoxal phosphate-dependent enzyme [Chlorogloea sp. CCALA 695]|uniref:aminotransferase class I/II-fold pyridoxal phosphate-dependent enzyme n=1 Tax=Chlorogloea sp. CCALA 695 TaxID=2107693 RepID=UPI000D055D66|nr:aminotransferase class I/II-fold pyridoxal phosphate-dependent enzyme [Chlorogloea sp. CCALA 695]PSB28990.1 arginine decarboxylase [Chlorogloea sp. CCALA 695]
MFNQDKTPLLDALKKYARSNHAAFYTPGHKRGQGISPQLIDCFGSEVFKVDLPELPEIGSLFDCQGVIQSAQEYAAAAFGADDTYFLVNGSTCGIVAAILATCGVGDKIILPRNVHQSAIAGLILSGATPIFINPEYDPVLDIAHSITVEGVESALKQHSDVKAVMMVYPTYFGVCGDVKAVAHLTHKYNIPLLVDEAHGAHFAFHPDLPISALKAGADLSIQSIHKTLGALTQASMLHVQGDRINRDRLTKSLELVQSSSPSSLLLASLDAARQQMAVKGKHLMSRTLQLAERARHQISQIPGLSVLELTIATPGFVALDKTRLTVNVSGLGLTGFAVDEILVDCGVIAELPSLQNLTFIISLGNTDADIEQLLQALKIATKHKQILAMESTITPFNHESKLALTPRQAFYAIAETLPIEQTCDRICAELVCPYPPGIPVLIPGEIVTTEAIIYLQKIQSLGGYISGCADSSLQTLKVILDKS